MREEINKANSKSKKKRVRMFKNRNNQAINSSITHQSTMRSNYNFSKSKRQANKFMNNNHHPIRRNITITMLQS